MTNQMLHSRDDTVSIVTRRMLLSTHPQNSHFLFVYSYPPAKTPDEGHRPSDYKIDSSAKQKLHISLPAECGVSQRDLR